MTTTGQPKASGDGADDSTQTPRRRTRRKAKQAGAIDIREALEAPVRVKQNGASVPMDPYEAMLRQQVRKSLVERSVTSIKFVLGQAEKFKLIETPPVARGGVIVIPKDLPEEAQHAIFGDETDAEDGKVKIGVIVRILLRHLSFEAVVRIFHGPRDKADNR